MTKKERIMVIVYLGSGFFFFVGFAVIAWVTGAFSNTTIEEVVDGLFPRSGNLIKLSMAIFVWIFVAVAASALMGVVAGLLPSEKLLGFSVRRDKDGSESLLTPIWCRLLFVAALASAEMLLVSLLLDELASGPSGIVILLGPAVLLLAFVCWFYFRDKILRREKGFEIGVR